MHLPGSLSSESKVKVDNMLVKTVRNWEQGMLLNEMHSTAKKKIAHLQTQRTPLFHCDIFCDEQYLLDYMHPICLAVTTRILVFMKGNLL